MVQTTAPDAAAPALVVHFGAKAARNGRALYGSETPQARIALIRPPILQIPASFSSYGAVPPIGLAYVAAVLRDAGHQITVIDAPAEALERFISVPSPAGTLQLNGLTVEEVVDRLDPQTEIIGISHMFLHEWPTIREIAERAKAKIPGAVVVLGGENATGFWEWIFKDTTAVDYCVLGEGESTMLELVARLKTGQPTSHIQGLASRATGTGTPVALTGRITKLETIPWPAWEYFDVLRYMKIADAHGVNRGRSLPIMATRGCPYQCTFCSSPAMWTTRYVTRTTQDVVAEMKTYVDRYGANNFNFCDLTAIIKREWTIDFCNLLNQEHLDVSWQLPSGTRSEVLDDEVLGLMYQAGCRNITYAPESGSERMLQIMKKRVTLSKMLVSLKNAERKGSLTRISIIIGHPEERRPDVWQSLKFIVRAALRGCHDCSVMIFAPYPGSADFKRLVEGGQLQVSENYYYVALSRGGWSSGTYNPQMGTGELFSIQIGLLVLFYSLAYLLRPWRFVGLVRGLVTGREDTIVHQTIRTKIKQFKNSLHLGESGSGIS
jgi:anaerobic magnesium-protoporphyrin IX monomethyl ester cyclase